MGLEGGDPLKKGAYYITILICLTALLFYLGLETKQILATIILLALVLGTVFFWEIRLSFALIGISVLIAGGLLSIEKFIEFSSLNIILFLAGMMMFVGYLEKIAFFEFLISKLIRLLGGGGKRLFFAIMIMSAFFAAIVDEVTSILFMLSIVLLITARVRVNPVPFVIMTIFATNIGSSASAVGNPVGVMIALSAKLSFTDFLHVATPISFTALIIGLVACFIIFNKDISEFTKKSKAMPINELVDEHEFSQSTGYTAVFFTIVMTSLVFHSQIEHYLGLEKNSMLLGTALGAAGIVLLLEKNNARAFVENKVDWWTLLFFMLLFSSVGTLEQSGVMHLLTDQFIKIFGSTPALASAGIMLISGFLTSALDNVLAVAVFIPLVHELQTTTIAGNYLWWSLLFGGTLFGNLTIIGSTANIIALGLMEKRGLPKITFMQWLGYSLPIVIITVATAFILLYIQIPHMMKG